MPKSKRGSGEAPFPGQGAAIGSAEMSRSCHDKPSSRGSQRGNVKSEAVPTPASPFPSRSSPRELADAVGALAEPWFQLAQAPSPDKGVRIFSSRGMHQIWF